MKIHKYPKLSTAILVLSFAIITVSSASAIWGSPSKDHGFFTDAPDSSQSYGHVIPNLSNTALPGLWPILGSNPKNSPVAPTKQAFINYIMLKLGSATQYSGSNQDQIGAAFIIQTMRGDGGGTASHWPTASNIIDWKNRINSDDISMYLYTLAAPNGQNSGYSPNTKDDAWISQPITAQTLVFSSLTSLSLFAIKADCGNVLYSDPLPVGSPIINGTKQDETGATNGPFAGDRITVSGATTVTNSSVGNPFSLNSDAEPITVTAANTVPGWVVVGHGYNVTCNTSTLSANNCNNPTKPIITYSTANSFSITPAKTGYVYNVVWVYRQVSTTINVTKVDTSGKNSSAVLNDTVRVYPSNSAVLTSSQNPFSFTVPSGSTSITADGVSGYVISSYVINNRTCLTALKSTPLTCSPITTPNNVGATFTQNLAPGYLYDITINFSAGIPPTPCPDSNITAPYAVTVSLPDSTPSPQTDPSPTSNNFISYVTSYTKQSKTDVTDVQDKSVGGSLILSIKDLLGQSYQQATVDYTKFVKTYPYDSNQAKVFYDSYYTTNNWKSTWPVVSYYTPNYYCPSGTTGPDVNGKCSKPDVMAPYTGTINTTTGTAVYGTTTGTKGTTTGTAVYGTTTGTPHTVYKSGSGKYVGSSLVYTCPSGYTGGGSSSTCSKTTYTCPSGYTGGGSSSTCTSTTPTSYTCPSGYTGGGSSSTCTSSPATYTCPSGYTGGGSSSICTSNTATSYTCPSGYTGGGTSSTCTSSPVTYTCTTGDTGGGSSSTCYPKQTYTLTNQLNNPTAWYNYILQNSVVNQKAPNTADAQNMTQCFYRVYSINSIDSTNANVTFNNIENPTKATAAGFTVSTTFSYPSTGPQNVGLRLPMKANLSYNYNMFGNGCSGSNAFVINGGSGPGPSLPNPTAITPGATCSVSLPPLAPGDTICANYTISNLSGSVNNIGVVQNSIPGTVSSGDKCSGPVVNEPYFKVFGSDISVGGSFYTTVNGNKTCTSSNSGIYGWNTGTSNVYTSQYAGSGAQFLLSSMSSLSGAASNQNNPNANIWPKFTSSSPTSDPIGFSLTNVGSNSAANLFGTSLGAATCMADYYSSLPASAQPVGSTSLSGSDGVYSMAGGSTISPSNIGASNVVGQARRITIYVSGDLYISGDINFVTNFNSINDIPTLVIIVKDGNIYIDKSVANLTGIFIAQSTISNKGYIYDCASGFTAIANNQLYDNCGKRLTVNGSFIANKVVLNRTGNATNDKISSSLRKASSSENNANTNATEIFNYGPAFWINTALPITTSAGTTSAGYDSIINLPPVL